jgi:hypothetical protein
MCEDKLSARSYSGIAWGILFLWLGILMVIPGDQSGLFWLGVGVILLGLNLVRLLKAQSLNRFSTLVGILALGAGLYATLHLRMKLPALEVGFLPVVLILTGLYVLVPSAKK